MTEYVLDTDTFIYLLKHDARVEASLQPLGLTLINWKS